jgi:peptidyl-prolyl cis-trans isomerase SurA
MMRRFVFLLPFVIAFAGICRAEIIDSVAASIGTHVITDSEVAVEARVTAFIQGDKLDLDPASKRAVLNRLIDQYLMERDMASLHFPQPSAEEVSVLLQQIRARYPTDQAWQAALARYGITEAQLTRRLSRQLATLRFIEFRFRPGVQVTDEDEHAEYRKQTAEWSSKHTTPMPSFSALQPQVEQIVRERLVDRALDRWLHDVRTESHVVYHGEYRS